jgi:hypothetical protein
MSRLLVRSALSKWTATLWRQQLSLLSNGITRIGFLFLLTASLMVGQYKWNWLWIIPPPSPSCSTGPDLEARSQPDGNSPVSASHASHSAPEQAVWAVVPNQARAI